MQNMFDKISVELPKPPSTKKKTLLNAIVDGCYMKKLSDKLSTPKKNKLIKKSQEEGDKIKRNPQTANQKLND